MRVKFLTVPQPKSIFVLLGTLALTALGGPADATAVSCDGVTSGQLQTAVSAAVAGTPLLITGICVGDVQVLNKPLTFINHTGGGSVSATDGISGQLTLTSGGTSYITGLTLENSGTGEAVGNLHVEGGAAVYLTNVEVKNAQQDGIFIEDGGQVYLQNTTIDHNGLAGTAGQNSGVNLSNNGILEDHAASPGSVIENNAGYGILASGGEIGLSSTNVENNTTSELALFGTNIRLIGVTVTATGSTQAIQAAGATQMLLINTTVSGPNGAVLVTNGTGLLVGQSTISTTSSTTPALEASSAASVVITGGDTITASSGTAIEIDHSSSLMHRPFATTFASIPGAANAVETITGAGLVQEQSSIDLGQGTITGSPSISWAPGANGISVQQNSSFRVSGGVSITGAVTIVQGSNAFANTANGGTNAITSANCPFTNVPSSHWASPAKVTPAVPSATSYGAATSPQCLAF